MVRSYEQSFPKSYSALSPIQPSHLTYPIRRQRPPEASGYPKYRYPEGY